MAEEQIKISELPTMSTIPPNADDVMVINNGNDTKKITYQNLCSSLQETLSVSTYDSYFHQLFLGLSEVLTSLISYINEAENSKDELLTILYDVAIEFTAILQAM